jgi:hypothetical protein
MAAPPAHDNRLFESLQLQSVLLQLELDGVASLPGLSFGGRRRRAGAKDSGTSQNRLWRRRFAHAGRRIIIGASNTERTSSLKPTDLDDAVTAVA